MARYTIKPLPKNTTVITVNGRFYPALLAWADQGLLTVKTFTFELRPGLPVMFSKRSRAVDFLTEYQGGRASWAIPIEKPLDAARRS
jgi:hypothetical protein